MARYVEAARGSKEKKVLTLILPTEEVPKTVQRSLKQKDWAFEARRTLYKGLHNVAYVSWVINFSSPLRLGCGSAKMPGFFSWNNDHKALVWQRSVCLRVLWCWVGTQGMNCSGPPWPWALECFQLYRCGLFHSSVSVMRWHSSTRRDSLQRCWSVHLYKPRKKKQCQENIVERLLQKLLLKCLGGQADETPPACCVFVAGA